MKKYGALLINAILAGLAISLGGLAFLKVKDMFTGAFIVGAVFFSIGLFTVCTRGYALYTGKVCYLFDNKPSYILDIIVIWIGNLIGCATSSAMLSMTSLCGEKGINAIALSMADAKLANSPASLFALGFFCNIFIFIGVNGYAKNPHEVGKYFAILFSVICFIVAGTEHSVADMFYFCISGKIYTDPAAVFKCLAIITLGNLCGGVSLPLLEKAREAVAK